MTRERGGEEGPAVSTPGLGPDAGHLDEDAEALEDPVHCGDARHQHDLHEQAHARAAVDPAQAD